MFSFSVLYVTHEPIQSLIFASSDWTTLPDDVRKSVRQYTRKLSPWTVNWVLLIAGQFNGKMLFVGIGNVDDVLVDDDVDVGLVEAVDADDVAVEAVVTAASDALPLAALEVAVALLALLEFLVLLRVTRAPTTPPMTAPTMTSRTTAATISAVRFGRPPQRRGWSAGSGG